MTRLRATIFDTIRPWLDRDGFTRARIDALDGALAALGIPADTEYAPPVLRPSKACLDLIKSFERCERKRSDGKLEAYPDPGSGGDPWTIGWGSTGKDIRKGTVWTQQQADERFAAHVDEFAAKVRGLIGGADTTQNQFDAMVSFAYNVGTANLAGSTLLRKHREGDYARAAAEFGRWNKAAGKVLAGLTRRREAEAAMYRGRS